MRPRLEAYGPMHGMICKALEGFLVANHGPEVWDRVRREAGLPFTRFEPMRAYEPEMMVRLMESACRIVDRRTLPLLEDIGHWICTNPELDPVRRLFRFAGASYEDFILSLDDVHDRARMALPDLIVPRMRLVEHGNGRFDVTTYWPQPGASAVLTGVLRAMADDYGALAMIEMSGHRHAGDHWEETVSLQLVERDFSEPRDFHFGGAA
ncbi:MAG: heme NO-binding domain-containing protein [Pseudomonadota bacterium]